MAPEALIIWLIVGGIAGWLASQLMKSGGLRLTGNNLVDTVLTGLIGAVIGGWLFGTLGLRIGGPLIGSIISATIGAVVLIFLLRVLRR